MKIERFDITCDAAIAPPVHLIGVGSGLGAPEPGSGDGPTHLQWAALDAGLRERALDATWLPILKPDEVSGEAVLPVFNRLRARTAIAVERAVRAGAIPLVLGGDHSCAVGTWTGVSAAIAGGALGLIWIDAHLDSHTLETTPSGKLHGMPLAALLGQCPELTDDAPAVLRPEHVCVIGARSFEAEEAALLRKLGVRVYGMDEIEHRGVEAVLREASDRVRYGTAAYGFSIDLDAFDPYYAPGVTTPVLDGLMVPPVASVLAELSAAHPPIAVEIVEYNPHRDADGITIHAVEQLAAAALQGAAMRGDFGLPSSHAPTAATMP